MVPATVLFNVEDCDDLNTAIHPEAVEVCGDGDGDHDDCDGEIDRAPVESTWYEDLDDDGYGDDDTWRFGCDPPAGWVEQGGDCAPRDPSRNPGEAERCNDDDDDCDGDVDEGFGPEVDGDGDGYPDNACGGPDCDDTDAEIHPHVEDAADDGLDQDCDVHDTFGGFAAELDLYDDGSTYTPDEDYPRVGTLLDVGDVNGDGIDDLLAGSAYTDTPSEPDATSVELFLGPLVRGTFTTYDADVDLHGRAGDHAGEGLAIGDFDGDGWGDLAIGAREVNVTSDAPGAVFLFFAYE